MEAAGAVDAKNAPTAPWKTAQNAVSHSYHRPHHRQPKCYPCSRFTLLPMFPVAHSHADASSTRRMTSSRFWIVSSPGALPAIRGARDATGILSADNVPSRIVTHEHCVRRWPRPATPALGRRARGGVCAIRHRHRTPRHRRGQAGHVEPILCATRSPGCPRSIRYDGGLDASPSQRLQHDQRLRIRVAPDRRLVS